jgi:hypothetical protein
VLYLQWRVLDRYAILITRFVLPSLILLTSSKYIQNSMLQETVFTGGSILGFFDFGTSILGQGVGVLIRARDLEGAWLGLGVLADDIEAILVRLSLIRGRSGGAEGVGGAGGARGAEGQRFRGIFSFNISYLGRESQCYSGAGQNESFLLFCSFFWWGCCRKV